ncbi:MAG: RNA-binding transcriptional accessory protein [Oscillospiraceae bacterium]|jgi:uncharacterized protein|nr:RNA-binding transcriptional accessory protein [Oscillospiraceae bacterium]
MNIQAALAAQLNLPEARISSVVALIDGGNTIPFIARYRKEATGGMDDVTLRDLDERLTRLRGLESRKAEVLRLVGEQGKLTPALQAAIESAPTAQRVEDLYRPYRKKRATRASKARDAGLEPLADIIITQNAARGEPLDIAAGYINPQMGFGDAESALHGALDIIAENTADDAEHAAVLRDFTRRRGGIVSTAVDARDKTVYETYYDYSEPIGRIPNHRVLAVNRGEKEGKLRVKLRLDSEIAVGILERRVIKGGGAYADLIKSALDDGYKRLIAPSLERDIRAELTERAETDAIRVFAKNTENLLQGRPVRGARVVAIDPGYRTGCKVAALDEHGKLLDFTTIYPTPPRSDLEGAFAALERLAKRYDINIIAIGNGTGSRETEEAVAGFIERSGLPIQYTIVNEAGASVYSASKLASEEYPDLDVTVRGAMSLGRRLQDPLAELVKIPPKSIGVGQYQHDLNQGALERALADAVENVVNRVGVNLNTASASLLGYVAGIGPALARNIVSYRDENGAFTNRKQLMKVPKLGEKAFGQCAGFLRIERGDNPLDATSVHPESYPAAIELLKRAGVKPEDLTRGGIPDIARRVGGLSEVAADIGIGLPTLTDIAAEIAKPGRDPRDDAPPVVFSRGIRSIDDLIPGMELTGTVRNVVDFGAFVDVGVKQDGLVHVSKMSNRYVRHPGEVVSVGDTVKVWVSGVDKERGKISLTMVGEITQPPTV